MTLSTWGVIYLIVEYSVKIAAIGLVPENRRPSSSMAWLLLILVLPVVGLPLFLLIGSPYVNRRRHRIQAEANTLLREGLVHLKDVPSGVDLAPGLDSLVALNRKLTSLPAVTGVNEGIYTNYEGSLAAMAAAIDKAERYVHVEVYIMAWDHTTDVFFSALARAASRGVTVRVLLDHIGSRKYPGFKKLQPRLAEAGITSHLMMPINPFRLRWRRPDLRNHRKLVVVDGKVGFMGSQNIIDSSYLMPNHVKAGRHWRDSMIQLSGRIVASLEAVFVVDWYTECGERLTPDWDSLNQAEHLVGDSVNAFQLVPSGPGFTTEPNLRLFTSLIHLAQDELHIVSPYFVPDESLLAAITTAAYRGVMVDLFVSEQADQFMVDHAQSSYYTALFESGVRIWRYPKPTILHSKFFTVDRTVAVFGSSNLDMRSFDLDYEITLMGTGGDFVDGLRDVVEQYRAECTELTLEQWRSRPLPKRYLDNVFRLTSALQ
ncbi:MAG: cardiolipin synthase [Actinomycetales bacterium]